MRRTAKWRADGTLRPTWVRRERRLRTAWLAQFEPGVREAFFSAADMEQAVFGSPYAREHGITKEEAYVRLAKLADERGWLRLATKDGRVVGIAPGK